MDFDDTMSGAAYGISGMAAGATMGYERMMGDIGSMMPPMASPHLHPHLQARHGMYAHEMSFGGSMLGTMGFGVPRTTSAYEFQELASRDVGQRVGTGVGMAAMYGTAAIASWHAGTALMGAGWNAGKHMGRHFQAGRAVAAGAASGMSSGAALRGGMMGIRAAGVAVGVAGAAIAMAPLLAMEEIVSDVGSSVKDRQDIGNFLEASSFRYATGGGPDIDQHFGAGFNTQARGKIAAGISQIAQKDNFFSMGDLKGVLESGSEMGMFTGVRDAEDFGKKFKELTSTLKQVTRTLHLSLEEGMKAIKDMKDQGFHTASSQQGALVGADVLGISSGRTASEMLTIGRQGAEMVRGTGIALGTGSTMLQQNTAMVDMMRQNGTLSREQIEQAGGTGALGQSMMGQSLNYMNSPMGRGMMMAMTSNGVFDPGAFQKLASGDMTMGGALGMAQSAVGNPKDYIQAVINRNSNMRDMTASYGGMGAQFGMMGSYMTMGKALMQTGMVDSMEDAIRFQMVQQGVPETQMEASIGMLKNSDAFKSQQMGALKVASEKSRADLAQKVRDEPFALTRAYRGTINSMGNAVGGAIDAIDEGVTSIGRSVSKWADKNMYGVESIDIAAVDPERAQAIIDNGALGRARDTYTRATGGESALAKSFTKEDQAAFVKTEAYTNLNRRMSDNVSAGMKATSLNEYSTIMLGKNFNDLSRDERMALGNKANLTNTAMGERIGQAQLQEEVGVKNKGFKTIQDADGRRKTASDDLSDIRLGLVDELGPGFLKGGGSLKDFAKSEGGGRLMDDLIKTKGELDQMGNTSSEARTKLQDKYNALSDQFRSKITKEEGSDGAKSANAFLENLKGKNVAGIGGRISRSQGRLEEAEDDMVALAAYTGVDKYLSSVDVSDLKTSKERDTLTKGVQDLRKLIGGHDADIGDLGELSKLANKSGDTALAKTFANAASRGDIAAAKAYLTKDAIMDFKQNSAVGSTGDGALSSSQAEFYEAEKNAIKALADVQSQTLATLEQLKLLADRLKKD